MLIADNEPGIHLLLQEVLRREGLRVEVVGDGVAALDRVAQGGVDLLVCDLMMPRMGGHEVLCALQECEGSPGVFVVSGHLDGTAEAELKGSPLVQGMLRKPFDLFTFASEVRRLLGWP